ncbi:hypothetical protein [Herpetosiphon gulosus]|uniref:Uncharacterized protein n=1 Tax=Herpetosiphon gulosus TaxID=1973496 RepID=A0ABP9X809_9CHLR
MIAAEHSQSLIAADKVVLVIGFGESYTGPHMAPDKKYYIRAGAHSGATGHFLVEAIRARRGIQMPMLRSLLRLHERKPQIIELVVTPLSDAPALNVSLTFNPFPKIIERHFKERFPVRIPVIDRANPFVMDLSTFGGNTAVFGANPVFLHLEYDDIVGRHYTDQQVIDASNGIGPLKIGDEMSEKVHSALKDIANELAKLGKALPNR